jgi:hypothetical protein
MKHADPPHLALLRVRSERPGRRAAEEFRLMRAPIENTM